jgi:hypothetical protein
MSEGRVVNPLVEQFRKGGVARELRLMAAQGALPLKPVDLLELLQVLLADQDEEVRLTAGQSLEARPEPELLPLLKDRGTPSTILDWALMHRKEQALREAVLQNTSTTDAAIQSAAAVLPEALAELVVINQVRLLRSTPLLEAIEKNPDLNNDQRRRLRELRESFRIGAQPEAPPAVAEPPAPPPAPPEPPAEEVAEEPVATEEEFVQRTLTEDERRETAKVGAAKRLFGLNTAGKVLAALKGGREERTILIRDPNRIVSAAVLGSPRVTEGEVEVFAAMKNISDEILRSIGTNREWTRSYGVVSNLVRNPRTPLAISMGLVSRLNPRDIKTVALDRNVPEPIRKQAQKFVKAKQG